MREITCSTITDALKKMCIEAATILPQDVEKALSQKHDECTCPKNITSING